METDRCELLCLDLEKAEEVRATLIDPQSAERQASRAQALGDGTRLTLAFALTEVDELCVCDLAWITGRADNLVSHHLRKLKSAGLVTSRRDGKMVLYGLTDSGRALVDAVGTADGAMR